MAYYLVTHSWEDYRVTLEYLGFASEDERSVFSIGDKVVYYGNGLVAGAFEVAGAVQNVFAGWEVRRPFQLKLKPMVVAKKDVVARPLRYKVQLEKPLAGSPTVFRLSEQEFGKIMLALIEGKELVY